MLCSQCGTQNQPGAGFCQKCGKAVAERIAQPATSSQPTVAGSSDESKELLFLGCHPWRRYFARHFDISIMGLIPFVVVAFALGILLPDETTAVFEAFKDYKFIAVFAVVTLWIPVEAILLSTVGNTPAKWLFGISVKEPDGRKLSFWQALQRSFLVALQGMALGIPVLALCTQILAYRRLTETGTTRWDTSANTVVSHKTWGAGRALICLAAVLAMLLIGYVGVK